MTMKTLAIKSTATPTRVCQNYRQWVIYIKSQVQTIKTK
jgi:hypothetical protein